MWGLQSKRNREISKSAELFMLEGTIGSRYEKLDENTLIPGRYMQLVPA